jgi:hypothetical protein
VIWRVDPAVPARGKNGPRCQGGNAAWYCIKVCGSSLNISYDGFVATVRLGDLRYPFLLTDL